MTLINLPQLHVLSHFFKKTYTCKLNPPQSPFYKGGGERSPSRINKDLQGFNIRNRSSLQHGVGYNVSFKWRLVDEKTN